MWTRPNGLHTSHGKNGSQEYLMSSNIEEIVSMEWNILDLPNEMIFYICSLLELQDLYQLARVSKKFLSIVELTKINYILRRQSNVDNYAYLTFLETKTAYQQYLIRCQKIEKIAPHWTRMCAEESTPEIGLQQARCAFIPTMIGGGIGSYLSYTMTGSVAITVGLTIFTSVCCGASTLIALSSLYELCHQRYMKAENEYQNQIKIINKESPRPIKVENDSMNDKINALTMRR